MKNNLLLALTAFTFFACSEDEVVTNKDNYDAAAVIRINVQGGALASGRAVEDGHSGNNGDKIRPDVKTLNVLAYNDANVLISNIKVDGDDLKQALYGDYTIGGVTGTATKPGGLKIGLPKGTAAVDVILNQYENPDNYSNINFFNDGTKEGSTFARVPLTSTTGKKKLGELEAISGTASDIPAYKADFQVQPQFARFEVHNGINVAAETDYVNYFGNKWNKIKVSEFLVNVKTIYGTASNIQTLEDLAKVVGTDGNITLNIQTIVGGVAGKIQFYGAILANAKNGFSTLDGASAVVATNDVYVPHFYWAYRGENLGASNPKAEKDNKIVNKGSIEKTTETPLNQIPINSAIWIENASFDATKAVKWFPNIYYAVDVEEIYINNIKVQNNTDPYLHPWPGSESVSYWPHWYEAYHIHGWHTAGKSSSNTFWCMGNMWDRISGTSDTNSEVITPNNIPDVGTTETLKMPVITGKATVLTGISEYYSTNRNLGIAKQKAAAYVIYPQSSTGDKDNLSSTLPHIIVKLKAYANATDYAVGTTKPVAGKSFITMRLFNNGTAGEYIKSFDPANIYRLDLSTLLNSMQPSAPIPNGVNPPVNPGKPDEPGKPVNPIDPDPEMPGVSLNVTIEVLQWTIQNIIPEI